VTFKQSGQRGFEGGQDAFSNKKRKMDAEDVAGLKNRNYLPSEAARDGRKIKNEGVAVPKRQGKPEKSEQAWVNLLHPQKFKGKESWGKGLGQNRT